MLKDIIYQKAQPKVFINGENLYDQEIDSYRKRYEEIRELATGKVKIVLLDAYQTMIISKVIINQQHLV